MVPEDIFFNIIQGEKYFDLFLKEMVPVDIFFNIIHGECSQQWPIVLLSQCVLRPPEPPSYLSVQEYSYKGFF